MDSELTAEYSPQIPGAVDVGDINICRSEWQVQIFQLDAAGEGAAIRGERRLR